MRLSSFLAPGSSNPLAGEVHDERVHAFAQPGMTVLRRLLDPQREVALGDSWELAEVDPARAPARSHAGRDRRRLRRPHRRRRRAPRRRRVEEPARPRRHRRSALVRMPACRRAPLDSRAGCAVVIGADTRVRVAGYSHRQQYDRPGHCPATRAADGSSSDRGGGGFCPLGPWIRKVQSSKRTPRDSRCDLQVNGGLRQDSSRPRRLPLQRPQADQFRRRRRARSEPSDVRS